MRRLSLSPLQMTLAKGGAAAIIVIVVTLIVDRIWPPDHLAELPPLAPQVSSDQRLIVSTPDQLARAYDQAGYDLAGIRAGRTTVPHLLLREWPEGFDAMKRTERKKALFARTVLPLILHVNRTIAAQRRALRSLLKRRREGRTLSHRERAWLRRLAALYRTRPDRTGELLQRVAPIPVSLAIAQAATETGWGTSRFARDGNALFGQWTMDEDAGLKPAQAHAASRHAVKAYDRLVDSAWDYARNLNTHRAYRFLRAARARGVSDGIRLAGTLALYSARGSAYVRLIRNVIRQNGLILLDRARLRTEAEPVS